MAQKSNRTSAVVYRPQHVRRVATWSAFSGIVRMYILLGGKTDGPSRAALSNGLVEGTPCSSHRMGDARGSVCLVVARRLARVDRSDDWVRHVTPLVRVWARFKALSANTAIISRR